MTPYGPLYVFPRSLGLLDGLIVVESCPPVFDSLWMTG